MADQLPQEDRIRELTYEGVKAWTVNDVRTWLFSKNHPPACVERLCAKEKIDGKCLLVLSEEDLKQLKISNLVLGELKRLYFDILELQQLIIIENTVDQRHKAGPRLITTSPTGDGVHRSHSRKHRSKRRVTFADSSESSVSDEFSEGESSTSSTQIKVVKETYHNQHHHYSHHQGYAMNLKPEVGKALVAMGYVFVVTWITALVMVIVHDRVPDMEKYPPLPDLFLDNMPHIPWAFEMCEVTGTILFCIWAGVLFFHKHRFILIRRFFALSGTVFLLRCVTMLITSLSVPGTHLQCNPRVMPYGDWLSRLYNAYLIWKGAGMSIQGVRTCGDYMFSGHTVALTMLNFFVTEYTTRRLYYIHTLSWLLNMFGIFFILAAHEHYSIDVFIAFYISSRLFLYYHTLANNQALMRDSKRTKVWFPLFSYFESEVDGIVPNQYECPITPCKIKEWAICFWTKLDVKWKSSLEEPREKYLRKASKMFSWHKKSA